MRGSQISGHYGQLSWTTNFRPDVSSTMSMMAQLSKEKFKKEPAKYIKKIKNALTQLHKHTGVYLQLPKLKLESNKLFVFSDA